MLTESKFKGPLDEFLGAHEHYRHGRYEECIAESLKAFESVLKAICDRKKWAYQPSATVKPLLDVVFRKELGDRARSHDTDRSQR